MNIVRGSIFLNKDMLYDDGTSKSKFLVLLNTPQGNDTALFVQATSQKKSKPDKSGCLTHNNESLFAIKANKTFFNKDTWIELNKIYEAEISFIQQIIYKSQLKEKIIDDIVNCLLRLEGHEMDIAFTNLLKPPLQQSLEQLQQLFNRR